MRRFVFAVALFALGAFVVPGKSQAEMVRYRYVPADGCGAMRQVAIGPNGTLYLGSISGSPYNVIRRLSSGVLTTIAGNGNFGSTGDGGAAVSAPSGHAGGHSR